MNDKRYVCEICEKNFSSKYNVRRHMETLHTPSENESGADEEELDEETEIAKTDHEDSSDEELSSTAKEHTPTAVWTYLIGLTMEEMDLTNKQEVYDHFKKFSLTLQKNVELHVNMVSLLKKDKLYQQLKHEEYRWVKRGFPCDEAMETAWKTRKIMIRKIIDHVFTKMSR